jgi:hypothetical protein
MIAVGQLRVAHLDTEICTLWVNTPLVPVMVITQKQFCRRGHEGPTFDCSVAAAPPRKGILRLVGLRLAERVGLVGLIAMVRVTVPVKAPIPPTGMYDMYAVWNL